MRPVILTFVRYYLPGFKSGGPVRTIANLVEALGDELDFRVVTSDRDVLDPFPYENVRINEWCKLQKSRVYYASKEKRGLRHWRRLFRATEHDVLYLNSLFDPAFTMAPLLARRFHRVREAPVIVAPRGELSPGALAIKPWKKRVFLLVAKAVGLYRGVIWHASTDEEAELIRQAFGASAKIVIARNLSMDMSQGIPTKTTTPGEPFAVVFLSRISRKKNLDYALRVLSTCNVPLRFDIWGAIEDPAYWNVCSSIIKDMPSQVVIAYRGVARPEDVHHILAEYDLLFVPTRGENFGHVIAEALSVGTPVLISDQTPWRGLAEAGVGWDLPLEEKGLPFRTAIEAASRKDTDARLAWRDRVRAYARQRLSQPDLIAANRQVFLTTISAFRQATPA
jgi:glycosyltransferase involved in cell wall biosynthesis